MGTFHHHAIVVTGGDKEHVQKAHGAAEGIFPWVSPISPLATNEYTSFFIPPDGSKERWPESDEGDTQRRAFYAALSTLWRKGIQVNVAEVGFGFLGTEAVDPIAETRKKYAE